MATDRFPHRVGFFQGDILGINAYGNANASIVTTKMGSNVWLTGEPYRPEGGLIVTCILLLGLLYLKFIYKKPVDTVWTLESDLPFSIKLPGKKPNSEDSSVDKKCWK